MGTIPIKSQTLKIMKKICSVCNNEKHIIEFRKNRNQCKKCYCYLKSIYQNNNLEKTKDYYINNKLRINANAKTYYRDNIEMFLYRNAKIRAKRKGREFNITLNDIHQVMNYQCPLLNIEMNINDEKSNDTSFTLDRIDSKKGYIKNNIIVISMKANVSKSNATINEYEKVINNLSHYKPVNHNNNLMSNEFYRMIFYNAKRRAIKKNIPFLLNCNYIKKIYPVDSICPLLKVKMVCGKKVVTGYSPSLDRIKPNIGYVEKNVMFVSRKANIIKHNLSTKEMRLLLYNWRNLIEDNGNI